MPDSESRSALLLGARPRARLALEVAAGRHPRVDYLELLARHQLVQVDFDTLEHDRSLPLRAAGRLNPYLRMALWLRGSGRRTRRALATGEDVGVPAALVQRAARGRTELFVVTHGSYLNSARAVRVMRQAARARRVRFLTLSRSLASHLIYQVGADPDRVETVGYGVDTEFFRPGALSDRPPRPLIVSAGTASRDYRTLVEAVRDLDAEVRIAADSEWFPAAVDIAGSSLPAHVEARSYGDYLGLRELYRAATVVVVPLYPGRHAAGYAVIAEAMAMGKPVIATHTASPSDFIVEGETGFLVPPGNPDALRRRIQQLLEDPDGAALLGARARARIEERYTVTAYVDRLARSMGLGAPSSAR